MSKQKLEHETQELNICADCLTLFANGTPESVNPSWCEEHCNGNNADCFKGSTCSDSCDGSCKSATDAHASAIDANWENWDITLGSLECEFCGSVARENDETIEEDCEQWFSWHQCHGCSSRYGGGRWHAVAWKRETDEEQTA